MANDERTITGIPARLAAGALGYSVALIGAGFASSVVSSDRDEPDEPYREFRQAPFAPPSWAFGPAWVANKLAGGWSLARVLAASPSDAEGRRSRTIALAAAAVNDVTYVAFAPAYFKLRSPVLAAAVTATSAAATVVQAGATARFDRAAAAAMGPQLAWLAVATPVALYQALYNDDPFLGTPAPLDA
jgi:tryptophan-rich sensory protein